MEDIYFSGNSQFLNTLIIVFYFCFLILTRDVFLLILERGTRGGSEGERERERELPKWEKKTNQLPPLWALTQIVQCMGQHPSQLRNPAGARVDFCVPDSPVERTSLFEMLAVGGPDWISVRPPEDVMYWLFKTAPENKM